MEVCDVDNFIIYLQNILECFFSGLFCQGYLWFRIILGINLLRL